MLIPGVLAGQQPHPAALHARMTEILALHEAELVALRHDLHQHPELAGSEVRTAAAIAARLEALGFTVRTGVGGHGVVGILHGAKPGPLVAYRADMDAVASSAPDPAPYRSLTPGVRHICGHDMHVVIGLGIAEAFAAVRTDLAGALLLVFQPAEERATGARAMLADGIFADGRPGAIYAVHTAPYPVGTLGTAPGGMMAGRAAVRVTLRGTGDLGAAAEVVRSVLRGSGTLSPALAAEPPPPGFVMVQVLPGSGRSSDPDVLVVRAQVTTAGPVSRERAQAAIRRGLGALAWPDVALEIAYDAVQVAGVTNDSLLVTRANASIDGVLGQGTVQQVAGVPPMFSEDFGSLQAEVPGVMYLLGVSNPAAGTVGMPHTDSYVADDAALLVGMRAMTAVLLDWMAAPGVGGRGSH